MNFRNLTIFAVLACTVGFSSVSQAANPRYVSPAERYAMVVKARADMIRAQAEIMKAQAAMIQARGQARRDYMEAAKMRQAVKSLAMDNEIKHAEVHYQKRDIREAYLKHRSSSRSNSRNATAPRKIESAEAYAVAQLLHGMMAADAPQLSSK